MRTASPQDCSARRSWVTFARRVLLVGALTLVTPAAMTLATSAAVETSLQTDYFPENAGQLASDEVRFYLSSGGFSAGLTDDGVLLRLVERPLSGRGVAVKMTFEGASLGQPKGRGQLPHR